MAEQFNPTERVITIQGGALYLQVKDRLIWARHDHPNLSVNTEMLRLDNEMAVFKATVLYADKDGAPVQGTGHGSETLRGFPPGFIEKAETIAIGRALATLGYSTPGALEEDSSGKLADAPGRVPATMPEQRKRTGYISAENVTGDGKMLSPQRQQLRALLDEANLDEEVEHQLLMSTAGTTDFRQITQDGGREAINALNALLMELSRGTESLVESTR